MFRESARRDWSARVHFYFHKAHALRHTSALLTNNARTLRHQYERDNFIKEKKKTCSPSIVEFSINTWNV